MFPSTGLVLTLKGNENSFTWARLVEGSGDDKQTDIRNHQGFYPIIDVTFPVCPNETLPPGQYSFPFSIALPDWLPASMAICTPMEPATLSVGYRLVAQFIPTEKKNWANDECNLSTFNAITPLYITRPPLQNSVAFVDTANKLDERSVCVVVKHQAPLQSFSKRISTTQER